MKTNIDRLFILHMRNLHVEENMQNTASQQKQFFLLVFSAKRCFWCSCAAPMHRDAAWIARKRNMIFFSRGGGLIPVFGAILLMLNCDVIA